MRLPNGIVTDKITFLGVDWSRSLIDAFDGKEWYNFSSLIELAEAFPNSMVFLEATAESFELQNRKNVLAAFEKHGIEAYCFPTDWTALYRKMHGIDKGTNGEADAKAIREIGTTWAKTLCRFKEITADPLGKKIGNFLVRDRHTGSDETRELAEEYLKDSPAEFDEFIKTSKKTTKTTKKTTSKKKTKTSKKKYRPQPARFVAVALHVRKAGKGYREFRRQIGNYAQGYGRMTRSEFYWYWTRNVTKARLKAMQQVVKKDENKAWWNRMTAEQQQIHRQVLKDADKVLKYIWQCTKA